MTKRQVRVLFGLQALWILLPLAAVSILILVHRHLAEGRGGRNVVVYCAHDSVYAQDVFDRFTEKTGIRVIPKYDSEATKSLGLVELLVREKEEPQCDLFWNNELLGTMKLKKEGVLQPYSGPGAARIPETAKDPDGYWAGFGARMRVWIVNRDRMPVNEAEIAKRMEGDLATFAMAKPMFGTTLTHYCCLWKEMGGEALKALHADREKRNICILNGNSAVKNAVASGACDFGWTDTDDFFVAKDEKKPVEMLPVRIDGKAICIPNTVSIVNGARNLENARILADYLLSEECELALANSSSRQIPLGAVDESKLSDDVRTLKQWASESYTLVGLDCVRDETLEWLKDRDLSK